MTNEAAYRSALALHRFGFGPRGDGITRLAGDPRGARKAARLAQKAESGAQSEAPAKPQGRGPMADGMAPDDAGKRSAGMGQVDNAATMSSAPPRPNPGPGLPQQIYLQEAQARLDAALNADIGFVERLVWFWSNHFCVSADKVRPLAGAFEREAIRPHVLGRFADMLVAVESHPAMLIYLDNARSIGPTSFAGLRRGKGLNENLAREILELHTLGVGSGYTQDDVTNFAKIITGWTAVAPKQERGGTFVFNARMHEPGAQMLLGKRYADAGIEQGRAALEDLARHPATARHVAVKLARHFVADAPPESLIASLADAFRRSDGNLKEVARALVAHDEAWRAERSKLKRPAEWLLAAYRTTGSPPADVRPFVNAENLLGEPLWRPPAPKGFPDDDAAWMDGLSQRLELANQLARRTGHLDPADLLSSALGPIASNDTRQAIGRAESRPQALALLLMSPEFLRR